MRLSFEEVRIQAILHFLIAVVVFFLINLMGFSKLLWIAAFGSFALCVPVFVEYFKGLVSNVTAWAVIFINLADNLFILSQIHAASGVAFSGINCTDKDICVSNSLVDGLYFSIVTFTTLGYGDYQPVGYGRYLAATQALAGYLVLGLTVGAILYWAQNASKKGRQRG